MPEETLHETRTVIFYVLLAFDWRGERGTELVRAIKGCRKIRLARLPSSSAVYFFPLPLGLFLAFSSDLFIHVFVSFLWSTQQRQTLLM